MKIYVSNSIEKENILRQSEYIHDFLEIIKYRNKKGEVKEKLIGLDSNKAGALMHIYMNPDVIVIQE